VIQAYEEESGEDPNGYANPWYITGHTLRLAVGGWKSQIGELGTSTESDVDRRKTSQDSRNDVVSPEFMGLGICQCRATATSDIGS
jgi:hypothetical protein